MSVVGFDIGNENCVIAVAKHRGIDVLLNDESKRETPAVVCFGEKQRFLGSAGAASAMMHPKSTISQVKRFIGRRFLDSDMEKDLKMLPLETSEGPDGGVLIHLKYLDETHTFTPVQIMSMLFAHLKTMTEKDLEAPISDCVIGIPSYFTDLQRRAYLDAAKIAGLKPLRLIHDCTATALSYGIYKTNFHSDGSSYVAFIDIGQCDTQVCIAAFEFGQMKILSHAFDRSLGGRDFDEVLFTHFAEKFKEQYSINVYSNAKACIRLRAACEKLKKVLSANPEAPLNIECLMDEKDVKGFITREEFENLASGLLERISIPCNEALAEARLDADKISSVELVGSGSRIPAVSTLLSSLFKREPSRKLNASECVARGCALQCAMLSPTYRVRDYEVQDISPFSFGLVSDEGPVSVESDGVIFQKGQSIPSTAVLQLHRTKLFHLEAFYANQHELPPGTFPKISFFTIGPLPGSQGSKARVKILLQLNLHGIFSIESATLIKDHADDHHSNFDAMDVDPVPETSESINFVANGAEDSTNKCDSPQSYADCLTKDKPNRRLPIPVNTHIHGGMTNISEAHEKELQLAQQDRAVELTKEKKNTLESYVYETRSKLFNTYRSFASDQERDDILRSLQETEDWLYEDGDDETEHAYSSKLEDLKKLVDPIENRYKDDEERAPAINDLSTFISEIRKSADSFPPQDKERIIDMSNKAEHWLTEKKQQLDSHPKNIDPILWSSDIKSVRKDLNRRIAEVKAKERRKAIEEILYTLVVQKFMDANVSLIPSITPHPSGQVDSWASEDGKLEELHSPEAYEMIQSHLALLLGNRIGDSKSVAQISKLRVGQVYAASVMYGYFLKRVVQRFQLEKTIKNLPDEAEENTISRTLESETRIAGVEFPSQVMSHPEVPAWLDSGIGSSAFGHEVTVSRLRSYMMSFDIETLQRYATIRSKEAVSIIENHTEALFGRPEIVITPEGKINSSNDEIIKISIGGLKRLVLEAVTFGSFLWDVESYVDSRYHFVLN